MLKIERDMVKMRKAKKLDEDKMVLLISYVQSKNCLWDENHPDFKKVFITKKFWDEIGTQLNITGDEAKMKWQKLKGKFKKLLRTRSGENGGPESSPAPPSWKFYNSMLFLKDGMRFEPTSSNMPVIANTSKVVSSEQPEENDDDFEEFNFDFFLSRNSDKESRKNKEARGTKPGPRSSKRKVVNNEETDDKNQEEPKEKKVPLSPTLVRPPLIQDERKGNDDHHFLLSLMPYIQALDPVEKLELRSQIQNLVTVSFKKAVNGSRKHP